MHTGTFGIAAALCAVAATAMAAEPVEQKQQLDDVVVTATRTARKTEEIPAGVIAISREDIKNTRMFGMKEALDGQPGVLSETKNGGYDSRLIIRGAGLKARYGVREIMVLLDGVPITDPDGMSRFDFIDTQLVDRIDVLKGPNSTLYGANAAGGVVNIISKSPYEEIKSVKAGYGSNNTQMYNLIYGTSFNGTTYVMLNGTRKSTDGWRLWNEFDSTQASLKVGHMPDASTTVDFSFSFTDANIQLPGTLTKAQFDSDPKQLTSEAWKHSGRYSTIYSTNMRLEKNMGDLKLKPVLYFQNWEHYHPVTGIINDGGANVYGTDIQADWKHTVAGVPGTLTAGVSAQVDDSSGEKYEYRDVRKLTSGPSAGRIVATLSDAAGDLAEVDDETISKWGVYAQESLRPGDDWIVDLGIRLDQVLFRIRDEVYRSFNYSSGKYEDDRQSISIDKTFTAISPRIGAVYKLTDVYSLYGTVSSGFQTPQSSELSENPNLDPSTTINYETGARARYAGGHSIDLSVYYMDVSKEIVQTYLAGGATSYSNAGSTSKFGAELAAKYQVLTGLFFGGNYTYSDFTYDRFEESGRTLDGNRLPYVPMHQYTLYSTYKHPLGFKAKLDTHTWGRYYVDNANSAEYKGYQFLTNAMVGYEKGNWDITFDVSNLFDQKYAMEVTRDTTGADRYRPGAPLSVFGKISYKF